MNYILGLDMGVSSLGWAIISEENQTIKTGVRIFPAGFDAIDTGKETNSNNARRTSRGMRRRIRRKAARKLLLRKNLASLGWIPSSEHERDNLDIRKWEQLDPYLLRHKALTEKVTLAELGRIILHLNQRRGFLSLRKAQDASDKDAKGILGEMTELETSIKDSGKQTLGSFLYHLREDDLNSNFNPRTDNHFPLENLRGRHLRRKLTHEEFNLIWESQKPHYPDILTETLRYGRIGKRENPIAVTTPQEHDDSLTLLEQFGLENLLFFQRRVYWPTSSIGLCQLEQPILFKELKEENLLSDKKERKKRESEIQRASVADRRFQEFRMLCEINNLRITNDGVDSTDERKLTPEEREICITSCIGAAEVKFSSLKSKLVKHLKGSTAEALHFNLEEGGRKSISGMKTDSHLKGKNGIGKNWSKLTNEEKNSVVEILTDPSLIDDDLELKFNSLSFLSVEDVRNLMQVDLGSARGNLSIKALEKLLPFLRQGMRYMAKKEDGDSAIHHAYYDRDDEQLSDAVNLLPRFDDPQYSFAQSITSPVVRRSLTELRKVVNGLIRLHGKPARIHVEMARSLKMSSDKRKEYNKKTRKRETERKDAAVEIEKHGLIANRDAIERYLLWKEQKKLCAYSLKAISMSQLFSTGEVDVDHVIPYSRCADNSFINKVVCYAAMNRAPNKGNQTPFEWLANADPTHYDSVIDYVNKHLRNGGKHKKFTLKEIPDGFTNRDLVDTAWMAKAARNYLSHLYPTKEHHLVQGTKGLHTATLRDHWKLNGLLRHDGIELKSRDDHRHHALDAVVIALTNKPRIDAIVKNKTFEQIEQNAKEEGKRIYKLKAKVSESNALKEPWAYFRESVKESLNQIWVSHRPKKKVSGALHKETYYGKTPNGRLVVRKSVSSLSKKDLTNIRDETISELIQLHLKDGGTLDDEILMPSGVPVKKVRVLVDSSHLTLKKGRPHETHVWSDRTHHVSIFSIGDEKCVFCPVNLMEAARRQKSKESIFVISPPDSHPNAEFLFHLSLGETILCEIEGKQRLFVYKTMAATTKQIEFVEHLDATKNNKHPETGANLKRTAYEGSFLKNFPSPQKVTILPTGEARNSQ